MTFSRRKFLLGTVVVSGAWVTWGSMPAWGVAAGAPPATTMATTATFMRLSALLVNHQLDAAVGARIAAAAAAKHADSGAMMASIIHIAAVKNATQVEDFFTDIPAGPLQDFAHWVIFCWYSGCSSPKKDAQLFTFEGALTYKTTQDVVAIPSYGLSGPNRWSHAIVPLTPMPSF